MTTQAEWQQKQQALASIGVKSEALVANQKAQADAGEIQYTLFASGLNNGRWSEFENKDQTNDLAIVFDAVDKHTYTKSYNKTSYAVESKAKASDNVVTQDGKISFSARITSSPYFFDKRNYIDKDTDTDNPLQSRRPGKALEALVLIADSHQVVTVVTEDTILTNYVITNLTFDRSTDEGASIAISLELEEFRFKDITKTVLAKTTDPKKASAKNSGTKQTADSGAAADSAKGKRQTPYISKKSSTWESWETSTIGTTDFSGAPGAQITPTGNGFNPSSILRQ